MKLKRISLQSVFVKEATGMEKVSRINTMLMWVTSLMIVCYLSTVIWILVIRETSTDSYEQLLIAASIFAITCGMVYYMVRFPIMIFFSKVNKRLLYLPIQPHSILLTRYRSLLFVQIGISVVSTVPLLFLTGISPFIYLCFLLYWTGITIIMGYLGIFLLLGIGLLTPTNFGRPALITMSILGVSLWGVFLKWRGIILLTKIASVLYENLHSIKLVVVMGLVFFTVFILRQLIILLCNRYYRCIFHKMIRTTSKNQCNKKQKNHSIERIHNPYLFLEIRFLIRNKVFCLYAIIKAVFVMCVLSNIVRNMVAMDALFLSMVCIVLISCFNPLLITVISRDYRQIKSMKIMPVEFEKMIGAKIGVNAMVNSIMCLILLILIATNNALPLERLILFSISYSIFAATVGLCLDWSNPNITFDTINDLIRNNPSTITQFIVGVLIIIMAFVLRGKCSNYESIVSIGLILLSVLIIKYKKVVM